MRPSIGRCPTLIRSPPLPTVADQIADFLAGRSNGEPLLHALYDYVLDEPIPESMRRLVDALRK